MYFSPAHILLYTTLESQVNIVINSQ